EQGSRGAGEQGSRGEVAVVSPLPLCPSAPLPLVPHAPRPIFYIRDNGIGIPQHHLETIFRLFKRLHSQEKYGGGAGAGLAIVKKIVELHNGKIWVKSTVGVGSIFYFTLE
ncbi:ATP-binding protein, partial [Nostoc sp. DedQUE09]|uniref:ATP-binding protein n=1 Tax=Nostoc sp. DedQUE09 TaxID=3075394 RepID=UPI002AD43A66